MPILVLGTLLSFGACPAWQHADARKPDEDDRHAERKAMVAEQLAHRGIKDRAVLDAMRAVKRHLFIPQRHRHEAYGDHPVPIGHRQTISQPYIVALMTEALRLRPGARVLEIGTGSGYQAAVLGEVAAKVYTIEIVEPLARQAGALLKRLGYRNIFTRTGDGYAGWPEQAPFDAVMLTAAPPKIPPPLLAQLKVGGVLVAPVGRGTQRLVRVTRITDGYRSETILGVRFVPMTGKALDDHTTPSRSTDRSRGGP